MKTLRTSDLLGGILFDIQKERERQETLKAQGKFTFTCADLNLSYPEKLAVLAEEFGEAAREVTEFIILRDKIAAIENKSDDIATINFKAANLEKAKNARSNLRKDLIETAAVCVAWCESLDIELDDRKDFPAEEQVSMTTNLADLTRSGHIVRCQKMFKKQSAINKELFLDIQCELHVTHSGKCGMQP